MTALALSACDEALLVAALALDGRAVRASVAQGASPRAVDAVLAAQGGLVHKILDARQMACEHDARLAAVQAREQPEASPRLAVDALAAAVRKHDERVVSLLRVLLAHDPGLPLQRMFKGMAPLHEMAYSGQGRAWSLLVAHGADPAQPTPMGRTAAHLAALGGQVGVLRRISRAGASVDTPDQEGATPGHLAASQGLVATLRELKRLGASLDQRDARGLRPAERLLVVDEPAGQQWLAWARRHDARLRASRLEQGLGPGMAAAPRSRI